MEDLSGKLAPCRVPTIMDAKIHRPSKLVTPMGERLYEIMFPSTDDETNSNILHTALFVLETALPKFKRLEPIVLRSASCL